MVAQHNAQITCFPHVVLERVLFRPTCYDLTLIVVLLFVPIGYFWLSLKYSNAVFRKDAYFDVTLLKLAKLH